MRAERELDVPTGVETLVPSGRYRQHDDTTAAAAAVVERTPPRRQIMSAARSKPTTSRQRRRRRRRVASTGRGGVGRRRFGRDAADGFAVQTVGQRTAQGRGQSHTAPGREPEDQTPEAEEPRRCRRHRIAAGTCSLVRRYDDPLIALSFQTRVFFFVRFRNALSLPPNLEPPTARRRCLDKYHNFVKAKLLNRFVKKIIAPERFTEGTSGRCSPSPRPFLTDVFSSDVNVITRATHERMFRFNVRKLERIRKRRIVYMSLRLSRVIYILTVNRRKTFYGSDVISATNEFRLSSLGAARISFPKTTVPFEKHRSTRSG